MYFTCEYQDNKVEVNDPDVRLRQVITGEGEVIKNKSKCHVGWYGLASAIALFVGDNVKIF